ncbi:MAG: 3-oxoacyl-ACP reductase FabG [Planctomycetes bacterium]|nr:3-oxoacyl-ACP reductase FabG [Planctomycetota bacterium]
MIEINLSGRVALVTGASRGIGRAVAETLGRAGAAVACFATTEERAGETARAIAAAGGAARAYGCDVADSAAVAAAVERALADFGGVDILVNNAGVTRDGLLARMSDDDWNTVVETNLGGVFRMTRALMRNFLKRRGGRIINIGSVVGDIGNAGQANYAASKGGVAAFTKSAARELASRGVLVNGVLPGFVATDMVGALGADKLASLAAACPLGRLGEPGDVAGAVLWLASDFARYVTGATIRVDGGIGM